MKIKILEEKMGCIKKLAVRAVDFIFKKACVGEYDCTLTFSLPEKTYNQRELEDKLYDGGVDCEFTENGLKIFFVDIQRAGAILQDYGCRNIAMAAKGGVA